LSTGTFGAEFDWPALNGLSVFCIQDREIHEPQQRLDKNEFNLLILLHKWCKLWPIIPLEQGFHHSCGVQLAQAMAMQLSPNRVIDAPVIPDRLYFKIGDVARICGVETYVLRFWETQFPQLKPNKSGTGQRLYRRRDVELALKIKHLVHTEGYTLAGARQALEQANRRHDPQAAPQPVPQRDTLSRFPLLGADPAQPLSGQTLEAVAATIAHARAELREIAGLLALPEPQPPRRRSRLATMPSSSGSLFPIS
jgi:DNA-binding transcriptional MerR regulator